MTSTKPDGPRYQMDNDWLGNVVAYAKLQIQNLETGHWQTLAECIDAPNAIKKELKKSKYKEQSIWIYSCGERRYHGKVK